MAKYLLGVDGGSTMVKAALFDTQGTEVAVHSREVAHIYEHPGWTENDMQALWESVGAVIRETISESGIDPAEIVCVTCTGHGNGLYLIDAEGRPVRNGIISSDARAREYIETWDRENILEKLLPKTMQGIWPGQPNALLRWLMDHEPEVIEKTRWMFMCKDYLRFMLTGKPLMERTDMSGTSLINVGTGEYDDEILAAWGLSDLKRIMPPLVHSGEICGEVTSEAAAATGLAEGTPVAGGMFDIDACGLAVGMTNETQLCMIAGTWGNNQYITREPVVSPEVFMTSCYSIPGYYLILEGSPTSASNLQWLVSRFFEAEKQLLEQRESGGSVFDICNDEVRQTKAEDTGIIFLPYLFGSPVSLDAKGCLFGLDGRHSRGHVLRAMYEGIVFGHYWHIEKLLLFRNMPATIRLTGGAVKSEVWSQMFADIFQTTVEIPAGTELGALGACICGAVAGGVYEDFEKACEAMVRIDRVYQPNPHEGEIYRKKYARYKKLLEVFQPVWSELAW